jgi:hypothetical protein
VEQDFVGKIRKQLGSRPPKEGRQETKTT